MRIYVIYDTGNPQQNIEQLEGFMSQQAAEARCEVLNARDYPDNELPADDDQDLEDRWEWSYVDVAVECRRHEFYAEFLASVDPDSSKTLKIVSGIYEDLLAELVHDDFMLGQGLDREDRKSLESTVDRYERFMGKEIEHVQAKDRYGESSMTARTPRTMTAKHEENLRDLCGIGGTMTVADQLLEELDAERKVSRKLVEALSKQPCTCHKPVSSWTAYECTRCAALAQYTAGEMEDSKS